MRYKRLKNYRSRTMLAACIGGIIAATAFGIWWYVGEQEILPLVICLVLDITFGAEIVVHIWAEKTGLEFTEDHLICHHLFGANKVIAKGDITGYRYTTETGPKKIDGMGSRGGSLGKERRSNTYLAPYIYIRELVLLQGEEELLRWDMREQDGRKGIEEQLEAWEVQKIQS